MPKGVDNCCYDKLKLLYSACKMHWFLEKHAKSDEQVSHTECAAELAELKKDLEKHIEKLKVLVVQSLK